MAGKKVVIINISTPSQSIYKVLMRLGISYVSVLCHTIHIFFITKMNVNDLPQTCLNRQNVTLKKSK